MSRDTHKFRRLAREKPGVLFAGITADKRGQLGQIGVDLDVGPHGPLFRKWFESYFMPIVRTSTEQQKRLVANYDEILMLVTVLDEVYSGRSLEVADILATRLRTMVAGVETGKWRLAKHYLCYVYKPTAMIPDRTVDIALEVERQEAKREKELRSAGGVDR